MNNNTGGVTGMNMTDFVTSASSELTAANLWSQVVPIAGMLGVLILFSVGIYFLRKAIRGAGKGKAKI